MKHIVTLFILLFLVAFCQSMYAQVTPTQARDLLAERGIPEDSLKARLLKKGYNPEQLRPEQLETFEAVVVQTISEYEADHAADEQADQNTEESQDTSVTETESEEKVEEEVVPPPVMEPPKKLTYGQEIFQNNSIAVYQKAEEITPSDDYILGVGDKIGVTGFGKSQFDHVLDIGPDGFAQPGDRLPKILLKGLRFADAKELLFQRYRQYYLMDRGEFQVSLNKPRNITVNVFGEVKTTGSFTLPAFNTAFNVLSAAGGPTEIGSVRKIKVISGGNVRMLDVYEFMNDPVVAKNFFLQNNDYIHVPIAEKIVEISGAITRPMSYELLEGEHLSHLIKYAGGTLPNGYLSNVKVTRFLEDKQVITSINFRELVASGGDYILYNGDKVEIKFIDAEVTNFVEVSGAVYFQGKYEKIPDMKISDLLAQSKLRADARLDYAYLLKFQPNNSYRYERINLQAIVDNPASAENKTLDFGDQLRVLALTSYADRSSFVVTGAVRNPNSFEVVTDGSLRLEDAILMAGGLLEGADDHGYVLRQDPKEPKTAQYINVDLKEASMNPSSSSNIEIKSGDRIIVFGKGEMRDNLNVNIYGAVRKPGLYRYGPGMTLADVVNLAGGLTYGADHNRIDIARTEIENSEKVHVTQYTTQLPSDFGSNQTDDNSVELKPFDHIYVRNVPEFESQQTVELKGEVRYPGIYPILADKERISDLVTRAGGLSGEAFPEGAKLYRQGDTTGLVVINLGDILHNNNIPSNVILLSGDVIDIPKSRELVTIGGLVNLDESYSSDFLDGERKISVAFRGEKSAKYYIDNFAAGVSHDGSAAEIKVQYADGGVEKTKKVFFFNKYPKAKRGSVITVGAKKVRPTSTKEETKVDWGNVLKETLAQTAAILTILVLVDQL